MFNTFYLSWKSLAGSWFPVGKFTRRAQQYHFRYLVGAFYAHDAGFRGLADFPDWRRKYWQFPPFDMLTQSTFTPCDALGRHPFHWSRHYPTTPFRWPSAPEAGRDQAYLELYPPPVRTHVDGKSGIEFSFFVREMHRLAPFIRQHWRQKEMPDKLHGRIFRRHSEFGGGHRLLIVDDGVVPAGFLPHCYSEYVTQQLDQGLDYQLKLSRAPSDTEFFPYTLEGVYKGEVAPRSSFEDNPLLTPLSESDLEMPSDSAEGGYSYKKEVPF